MLDKVQTLCVAGWRAADDIVNLDVILLLAHTATIHGVGKLDEDGVFLHDTLDMLAANTNDSLMILIRDMERYRSRHFLLHKIQTVLRGLVLISANVNIEVVLVEAIKDDLHVACSPS